MAIINTIQTGMHRISLDDKYILDVVPKDTEYHKCVLSNTVKNGVKCANIFIDVSGVGNFFVGDGDKVYMEILCNDRNTGYAEIPIDKERGFFWKVSGEITSVKIKLIGFDL